MYKRSNWIAKVKLMFVKIFCKVSMNSMDRKQMHSFLSSDVAVVDDEYTEDEEVSKWVAEAIILLEHMSIKSYGAIPHEVQILIDEGQALLDDQKILV